MTADEFIDSLEEPRRSDVRILHEWIVKARPYHECVVASPLLGYGPYKFHYASGREGSWYRIAVANRKNGLSIRVAAKDAAGHLVERYRDRLPKAKVGKGSIAVKRVTDLDFAVMAEILRRAEEMGYPFAVS